MKSYLPILSFAILFASCTSAYKSGQTPDDVYFSPARPQDEYVRVENNNRKYYSDDDYRDDRYLRMKVLDRRWSMLDDGYAYGYRYGYNYYPTLSYGYYSSWNPALMWNYYYNPYCTYNNVIITNPKAAVYNKPRSFNLHVFDNTVNPTNPKAYTPANPKGYYSGSANSGNYNNSGTNAGGFLRNIFSGSESNSGSGNSKTYSSGSSSNNSSGGSSNSGSSGNTNTGGRGNASRGKN